jgi:hypothetical protein
MALFSECMRECAQKALDTADIVRDACFRQPSPKSVLYLCNAKVLMKLIDYDKYAKKRSLAARLVSTEYFRNWVGAPIIK